MSAEFVDTKAFWYTLMTRVLGKNTQAARRLIAKLTNDGVGATSTQVLAEFYSVATRKLKFRSEEAEEIVSTWIMRLCIVRLTPVCSSPCHPAQVQDQWWDALIVNSALELGCSTLWTEDLKSGQRFSTLTARNPFA